MTEKLSRAFGHMIVCVDLAVGVRNGGANFGAAIFKNQDVLNIWSRCELMGAFGPQINHFGGLFHRE
jgi:hypothetical protein